jgi:HSP20 family molecular chaperone IbpA
MIDDDEFQKIFRRMIEQFFGTFGMQPGGSGIDKIWDTPSDEMDELPLDMPHEGPRVERIDLEDSVILVMDECLMKEELQVSVRGEVAVLSYSPMNFFQQFETPFIIDADRSRVSCRNGVAEIRLEKDESTLKSDNIERILEIE